VFFFEQIAQGSNCQASHQPGPTQVRCHAREWRASRRLVKRSANSAANSAT